SDEGYAVTIVRNGKDALDRVAQHKPDLILLDYMMPVMDGGEVLHALAASPEWRSIPVIMMSAVKRTSLPAGLHPSGFLRKPFDIAELFALMANVLPAA